MLQRFAQIELIKRLCLIALVSDDFLFETLVLKGGNALGIAYDISNRGSFDMDFSMEQDFEDLKKATDSIEHLLNRTFSENGYCLFDYRLSPRPNESTVIPFWGGYQVEFKLIGQNSEAVSANNLDKMRREALTLGPSNSTKFTIDISKFEYVSPKISKVIDGYTYYVYAPQMIVFEKMRAICQQLPHYLDVIPSHSSRARSRDFYDIHAIMEHFPGIDVSSDESKLMLTEIFAVKKVPVDYITRIRSHLEIHRHDFASVVATVREKTEPFQFYADFVLGLFEPLF